VHAGLVRRPDQRIQSAQQLVEMLKPFTGGTLQITGDAVVGVSNEQRNSMQPRLPMAQQSGSAYTVSDSKLLAAGATDPSGHKQSVAGLTSSGATITSPKKSSAGTFAALAIVALVLVGGATFAVNRFVVHAGDGKSDPSTPRSADTHADSVDSPTTPTTTKSTTPPTAPVDDTKTATLTVKIPKGASLRVGKDDWTSKIANGKITLSGDEGQQFLVSVWQGKQNVLTQKVYMGDGFLVPDEIDTAKGEQIVKPPPTGGKPTGTNATSTATKPTGESPTTKPSTPPTVATTFE
jgi:hypothetical protein